MPENPAALQELYHSLLLGSWGSIGDSFFVLKDYGSYSMAQKRLNVISLGSEYTWFDAGNADSLYESAGAIRTAQRSGKMVGCPEEAALKNRWITVDLLRETAGELEKTQYGQYLFGLIEEIEDEE